MPQQPSSPRAFRLLTVLAVGLWLAVIAGSAVFLYAYPRYLSATKGLRMDAKTADNADRLRPRPDNDELIEKEAVLIQAGAQAIWAVGRLAILSSLATVVTLILVSLNRRFAQRQLSARLSHISQQLERIQGGQPSGPARSGEAEFRDQSQPIVESVSSNTRRSSALNMRTILNVAICLGLVFGIGVVRSHVIKRSEEQRRLKADSLLVRRMAENTSGLSSAPKLGENFTLPVVGLEMIWLEAGSFSMGGNGRYEGRPVTRVTLTGGFWLGKYPLTQGEYQTIMHQSPPGANADSRTPVFHISWFTAMELCRRLTDQARAAGRLPGGYAFTLPTEAQWEYACRAGNTGNYIAESDSVSRAGHRVEDFWWLISPSGGVPAPVGHGKPNAWGFYDMFADNSQWCLDWYAFNLPGGSVTNPVGPTSGLYRVSRGSNKDNSGPERRVGVSPHHATMEGIRIALSPVPTNAIDRE